MKTAFRVILVIFAIFFATLAFRSIMRPEKFKMVYETRKTEIRNKLTFLRAAQAVYKNEMKVYASDIDSLVDFVENGMINIVKITGDLPEGMTEEQAFKNGLLKKEIIQVPVMDKIIETDPTVAEFKNKFQFIPHTNGKKFKIQVGSISSSTYVIPVYRVDVALDDILDNMNESITPENTGKLKAFFDYLIYGDLENEQQYREQYKDMWLGSLIEANTSGSWE